LITKIAASAGQNPGCESHSTSLSFAERSVEPPWPEEK